MSRVIMMVFALLGLPTFAALAQATPPAESDQAEAVRGNNAFAVELYGHLKNQPGSLFFSPECISTALAMTHAGAHGETAAEMERTLHFTLPSERLHPAMGGLLRNLNAAHDGYELKVANALWGQQGYTLLDDFLKLTKDNYGAGLNFVDFKGTTEAARQTINQWFEQQTEKKIKDLIAPGVLNAETRLILTSAIYFKGDWETQFKKEDTRNEDFHISATQTVKASLMHLYSSGGFSYFDGGIFQALEIPYKNKELSMIAFLPKNADGLAALEQSMNATSMEQWLSQLQPVPQVIVTMPKFKMEKQFALRDSLMAIGMKQAFDSVKADFSGMASKETMQSDGNLYISAVIHKGYIDVNEKGTEAAAGTAVIVSPPPVMLVIPLIFRADHPFLFLIRDNRSGGILFMGRVNDPSA